MRFYEEHEGDRDRFEIIAFHDASVDSLDQLKERLATLEAKVWNGKSLPFPVLLDTTGKTIEQYGITYYPTTILIDPEGKLVGETNHTLLAQKLQK